MMDEKQHQSHEPEQTVLIPASITMSATRAACALRAGAGADSPAALALCAAGPPGPQQPAPKPCSCPAVHTECHATAIGQHTSKAAGPASAQCIVKQSAVLTRSWAQLAGIQSLAGAALAASSHCFHDKCMYERMLCAHLGPQTQAVPAGPPIFNMQHACISQDSRPMQHPNDLALLQHSH